MIALVMKKTTYYFTEKRIIVFSDYKFKNLVTSIKYEDIKDFKIRKMRFDRMFQLETVVIRRDIKRGENLNNRKLKKYAESVEIPTKDGDKITDVISKYK